jgi:hypothetical protein
MWCLKINIIIVISLLTYFSHSVPTEGSDELSEILADMTDLYDIYASETKFGELKGVVISPESNEVIWIKNPCDDDENEQTCDFYVQNVQTLLTIEESPRCSGGISFSLDPKNPLDVWGPYFKKVYYPTECASLLRRSIAGAIMFDADWDLKQLSSNSNNIGDGISGYHSVDDLRQQLNSTFENGELMTRLWVSVPSINVSYSSDGSIVFFDNVELKVNAANLVRNSSSPTGTSDSGNLHPSYQLFLDNINKEIQQVCKKLKSFRKLKQLAIAHEAAKFIRSKGGIISGSQMLDFPIDTPDFVPAVISTTTNSKILRGFATVHRTLGEVTNLRSFDSGNLPSALVSISLNASYHCSLMSGKPLTASNTIEDLTNTTLSCYEEIRTKSSPQNRSTLPLDQCPSSVSLWDANDQKFYGIPSSYIANIESPRFFNFSGPINFVKWNCSTNILTPVYPSRSSIEDTVVLMNLVPHTPKCDREQLLDILESSGARGVIFISTSPSIPQSVRFNFTRSDPPMMNIPIRLVSSSVGKMIMNLLEKDHNHSLARLNCGVHIPDDPPSDDESESGTEIDPNIAWNVTFEGSVYFTLDLALINSYVDGCQREYLHLDNDYYEIAPATSSILENVVAIHFWGTRRVILNLFWQSNGKHLYSYWTKLGKTPGLVDKKVSLNVDEIANVTVMRPSNCEGRILVRSISRTFKHGPWIYKTLDDAAVIGMNHGCQTESLSLPPGGWHLVPPHSDILRNVVAKNSWDTLSVLLANNRSYFTGADILRAGQPVGKEIELHIREVSARESSTATDSADEVVLSWPRYVPSSCSSRILIRRPAQLVELQFPEETHQYGDKRRVDEMIKLTMTVTQDTTLLEIESRTTTLTHGGVTLKDITIVGAILPPSIENQIKSELASGKTFVEVKDWFSGKVYSAVRNGKYTATVSGYEVNFPNIFKSSVDFLSGKFATMTESLINSNQFSPTFLQQQQQQRSTLDKLVYQPSFHQYKPTSNAPQSFPNLLTKSPIVDHAQSLRGSLEWGRGVSRSSDHFPAFGVSEPKCNLFVAEMYADLGYEVPVNANYHASLGRRLLSRFLSPLTTFSSEPRPYLAKDYYNGEVPGTLILGKNAEGLSRAQPGDIISDGRHMAIISGDGKSIHAMAMEVVENNFGFRPDNTDITVIRVNWPKK